MNIDELKKRCRAVIQIQEIVAHALSHFSGLTDTELARFLEGTFTPSDEQLQKLEDRLIYEEQNQPRIQGHGVPRRDVDIIESFIYNAGRNHGLTFTQAIEIAGGDDEKTERLLRQACEDDLMTRTGPHAFNTEFIPVRYYLTNKGEEYFQQMPSEETFNFPRA